MEAEPTCHPVDADGLPRLERAIQPQLLRHLAQRPEHLLAEQPDAGFSICVRVSWGKLVGMLAFRIGSSM